MRELPEDLNWRYMVANLRQKGMTHSHISLKTGFTVQQIRQMESEVYYPPYLSILKLVDLHFDMCEGQHNRIGS